MDIKNPIDKYDEVTQIVEDNFKYKQSIEIIKTSNIDYEFRTTVVKGIHTLEDIEKISKFISGCKKYYLQNFKKGEILDKCFNGSSFSKNELFGFKKMALKYIKYVEVRD